MSNRDCGRWYCQGPAGFGELVLGVDVLLAPVQRAAPDDRGDLDRESDEIAAWMWTERQEGWGEWLAAYNHAHGAAAHYWVWDPDSRGRYLEAQGPFSPGTLPPTFGDKNADGTGAAGMGWQLPLVAVFTGTPTPSDLVPLQRNRVPFINLQAQPIEPPEDPPEDPPIDEDDDPAPIAIETYTRSLRIAVRGLRALDQGDLDRAEQMFDRALRFARRGA